MQVSSNTHHNPLAGPAYKYQLLAGARGSESFGVQPQTKDCGDASLTIIYLSVFPSTMLSHISVEQNNVHVEFLLMRRDL
jgi:hypothetical protein